MNIQFKRLGKNITGCIVADTVMAAVLIKSNGKWEIDDMIPEKYLNFHKQQEIYDAINKELNRLNSMEVVSLVMVK